VAATYLDRRARGRRSALAARAQHRGATHCRRTVYFPHPKRTAEALDAFGLLEQFVGVLVYDHWSPFSKALVHIMAKQAGVPVREFCRLCKDKKLLVTGILIE